MRPGYFSLAALSAIAVCMVSLAQDPERGRDLFEKRCSGCHALDRAKEGPPLKGVYGRAAGTVASFPYSDALKNAKVTWDAASLDQWLSDPDKVIPKNDMEFRVPAASERADIIAFLKKIAAEK